jgi:hypothetical protein
VSARLTGVASVSVLCVLGTMPMIAAAAESPVRLCLAPPSAQMPGVNSEDALASVRTVFTTYLTGPSLRVEPLTARLASQTREEAKQKGCTYVLYTKVNQERKTKSTGLLGRIAAGALQNGASQVAASSGSAGTRVLASAAAGGAASTYYGSYTQTSDKLTLTTRLEAGDGRLLSEKTETRKAGSDGEDLLTPMVERASETVVGAMSKGKP